MTSTDLLPHPSQPVESHLATREEWQAEIAARHHIGDTALSNILEPLTAETMPDPLQAFNALRDLVLKGELDEHESRSFAVRTAGFRKAGPNEAKSLLMAEPLAQEALRNRQPVLEAAHQELFDIWPGFVELYTKGVREGIRQGYIPAEVENRLETALAKTGVRVADVTALDAKAPSPGFAVAEYDNKTDEVSLGHNFVSGFQDDLAHEFTHKTSGGTFIKPKAGGTAYYRSRTGFATEIAPDEYKRIGLTEATNHHKTLGILTGDFDTFDPDLRADGDKTYYEYRKIVATFIARSAGLIDVKSVTNASYEDTSPQVSIAARRKMIGGTTQAYGPGAWNKLEKLMEVSMSQALPAAKLDEVVLSRIHPPELDSQGNVVARGWIDTDNLEEAISQVAPEFPAFTARKAKGDSGVST